MEVVITSGMAEAASLAADAIEKLVGREPSPVIGLATGSSPLPIYRELIARFQQGRISFASTQTFLLDEYVGLAPDHPESYRAFIQREFADHVDLAPGAVRGPDGSSGRPAQAAQDYEDLIADAGGIHLQLLGIGSDGHIGFNEPTSSLASRTRLKTLTDATRRDNARFFDGDIGAVPRHVLTQGIGTILESDHLVLIASGPNKSQPIALGIEGPLTSMVPASALQLHPRATVLLDDAAAADLQLGDYYREAFRNKPDWQTI